MQQLPGLRIDGGGIVEELVRVLVAHDPRQLLPPAGGTVLLSSRRGRRLCAQPLFYSLRRTAIAASSARVSLSCGSFSTMAVSAAGFP
jgi:hypothetical protein